MFINNVKLVYQKEYIKFSSSSYFAKVSAKKEQKDIVSTIKMQLAE